ncbi:hypothetical protein TNCV_4841491 [Trichonephila clavipes]|uniref:Uncharacterized protein n=1 Tax=Trichonephila clavipes TaxID=2585209 RepID=A0A8X6WJQ3_TRICX|nr:hypothetical protein TNCV_4841491 [Trichonephila clavipes]
MILGGSSGMECRVSTASRDRHPRGWPCYQVGVSGSYSHNKCLESGNGFVFNTTGIHTDSVTASEAEWTVFIATIIATFLDTAD